MQKENYQNIEVLREGGLKCDNSKCDYINEKVDFNNYENWVDKPCPKCGENLLTEEDFLRATALRETIKIINSIPPEELESFSKKLPAESLEDFKQLGFFKDAEGIDDINENTESIKIALSTHNEVKAVKVEDCSDDKQEE